MSFRRAETGTGRLRLTSLATALILACVTVSSAFVAPSAASADPVFRITGRGYGHGIGLSQWGAKGFAENGYRYDAILAHYYHGTTLGTATTKTVRVAMDKDRAARSSWTLRAGTADSRLVIDGVVAPADNPYRFVKTTTGLRAIDAATGTTWRDFPSTVRVVEATADIAGGGRTEESAPAVTYSGTWVSASSSVMSGGTYRYASAAGASATLRFRGTSIAWIGPKHTNYGQAEVWLDGVRVATVSQYATTTAYQQTIWSAEGLSDTTHTLQIKVLGTKESASSGTIIVLDAFDVGGDAPPVSSTQAALVQVYDPTGMYDLTYVRFRGVVELSAVSAGVHAANILDMESYLYGVVPRESPPSWHLEALKAQAVAARSYAHTESTGELYPTTRNQVYGGHSRGADRNAPIMHEDSRTNRAVDDTVRQVIRTGSGIARGYFFSSSGGHTANNEDVWGGTAISYLRGVQDPYEAAASPETGWPWSRTWGDPITYTGTSLASALGYGSPVVSLSVTTASSGHVRSVGLRLADGSAQTLTGDRFRSRLGLKSTVFQISSDSVLEVPSGMTSARFEESDPRLAYAGTWVSASSSAMSGGSYRYSYTVGSTLTARFRGTSIAWLGSVGPAYGRAEVYLDGSRVATVSQYASAYAHQQRVWERTGLADAEHTLQIRILGTKDAASSWTVVIADALEVGTGVEPPAATSGRIDDRDTLMSYAGTWVSGESTAMSEGTYRYAHASGSSVSLRLKGSRVGVVGSVGPSYGLADVYLDGVKVGAIDAYAAEYGHQRMLWERTGLTDATHVIEVRVLGAKNPESSANVVVFDAIDVDYVPPGEPGEARRIDDRDSRVGYAGTWVSGTSSAMSGGTYRYSYTAGSTATLRFRGTAVTLIGSKGPAYGRAEVYLDGVKVATISAYDPAVAHQATLFERSGLTDAEHTLQIRVLGTKDTASSGATIVLDGFDVVP